MGAKSFAEMGFCKRRRARLMDKKQVAPRKKKTWPDT